MSANYGLRNCAICRREFQRKCGTQKLCGRLECRKESQRRDWHKRKAQYRKTTPADRFRFPDLGPPRCVTCGGKVQFGSDPRNGVSVVWCLRCGEQPLQRIGVVTYPQRPELEDDMRAAVVSAQAPLEKAS